MAWCSDPTRRVGSDPGGLASTAASSELLISLQPVAAAATDTSLLEHRTVDVRGRAEPVAVLVVQTAALVA